MTDLEKAINNLETADRYITHNPSEIGDNWLDISNSIDDAIEALKFQQNVVRCKNCILRTTTDCAMNYKCECGGQWSWETNEDFCSYGKL